MGNKGWSILFGVVMLGCTVSYAISPWMGWGLPDSPGHYLDLISAMSGIGLLLAAGLTHFLVRVRGGK